jgi:hypothetical protein
MSKVFDFCARHGCRDPEIILEGSAGSESELIWRLREEHADTPAMGRAVSRSCAGLSGHRADSIRDKLLSLGVEVSEILRGLSGVESERWRRFRESCLSNPEGRKTVGRSLIGLRSAWSDSFRGWLFREGIDRHGVLMSLIGRDDESSWQTRAGALEQQELLNGLTLSIAGVPGGRARKFRRALLQAGASPEYVAHSLMMDASPDAWALREELLAKGVDLNWVALGLARIWSARSWKLRRSLLTKGANFRDVAHGIEGDYLTGGFVSGKSN